MPSLRNWILLSVLSAITLQEASAQVGNEKDKYEVVLISDKNVRQGVWGPYTLQEAQRFLEQWRSRSPNSYIRIEGQGELRGQNEQEYFLQEYGYDLYDWDPSRAAERAAGRAALAARRGISVEALWNSILGK